jgi:hypothetical protein
VSIPSWDPQIWATARVHQIPVILTESFDAGQTVEGVRFVGPLAEDFDVNGLCSM